MDVVVSTGTGRWKRGAGLGVVYGVATGICLYYLAYFLAGRATRASLAFDLLPPLALSVAAVGFYRWHTRPGVEGRYVWHVAVWVVAGTLFFAAAGGASLYYLTVHGSEVVKAIPVTMGWASGGALVGGTVGVHDAERRRQRDRVTQLNQRLTVLQRVLRHDIRNGANVITGSADLVLDDPADAPAYVQTIKARVGRLVHLSQTARDIEQLLEAAETETTTVDVAACLRSQVADLAETHPAVAFDLDLPAEGYAVAAPQLDLALRNVLENAVEHNDRAAPTVDVSLALYRQDGQSYVEVRVVDDGAGLPPVERRVLDSEQETPLRHSTGLGLWLVRWIVDESGGELRVGENDPHGTVVSIRLPAAASRSPAEAGETGESVEA